MDLPYIMLHVSACSCGNRAFAVNSNGTVLWQSQQFGTSGYPFDTQLKLSPSIHPKGLLYFIDVSSTKLIALSTADGSLVKVYPIPEVVATDNGCIEPPILVGDEVVYVIKMQDLRQSFLFSISVK